jgi:hypothetical protein
MDSGRVCILHPRMSGFRRVRREFMLRVSGRECHGSCNLRTCIGGGGLRDGEDFLQWFLPRDGLQACYL